MSSRFQHRLLKDWIAFYHLDELASEFFVCSVGLYAHLSSTTTLSCLCSYMVSFQISTLDSSNFGSFFGIVLAIRVSLPFPLHFWVIFVSIYKNFCCDFAENCIQLFISIGRIDIFYSVESSACEHGMSLRYLERSWFLSAFCSFRHACKYCSAVQLS